MPTVEKQNRLTNFDFATGQVLVAGTNGATRAMDEPDKTDFAPRIGLPTTSTAMAVGRYAAATASSTRSCSSTRRWLRHEPPFFGGDLALGDDAPSNSTTPLTTRGGDAEFSAFDTNYKLGRAAIQPQRAASARAAVRGRHWLKSRRAAIACFVPTTTINCRPDRAWCSHVVLTRCSL